MKMPCHITDLPIDPYDYYDFTDGYNEGDDKSIEDITLYDLLGGYFTPYIKKNNDSTFNIEIETPEEYTIKESNINEIAMESLAQFCRDFLRFYEK